MLFEFLHLEFYFFILRLTGFKWKARNRKDAVSVVVNVAVPTKKKIRSPRIVAHKVCAYVHIYIYICRVYRAYTLCTYIACMYIHSAHVYVYSVRIYIVYI